jgi:hypothetical protein
MATAEKETGVNNRLTYDAHFARLEDMRRRADERRAAARHSSRASAAAWSARTETDTHAEHIAIRRATEADAAALERLAALDSAPAPSGEALIAEVGDEPLAALAIVSGAAIADPFRPTAHLVELLRLRAASLREAADPPRRLRRRRTYRAARAISRA